jgi:DNA-directed RNA polymerase III subunit RPC6
MREIGDAPKKKRKRSPSVSSASSSSSSSSSSDSDSDAASDASSKSASSVDTDDIDDEDVPFKPDTSGLPAMMSNPFDLSDTQIVYRATKQLDNSVLLGQMHTPCGRCPQFTFCEESGPVNAKSCEYYSKWLIDEEKGGGWERGTALMKMRPELKEEEEPVEGVEKVANGTVAEAVPNGTAATNGHDEGMDVDSAPVEPGTIAEVDEEPVVDDE